MQTTDMKRLLVEDKKSKSGWRIVGYEWHKPYKTGEDIIICHLPDINDLSTRVNILVYTWDKIKYTAYEQGILVDEWWFEGDIIEYSISKTQHSEGELKWDDKNKRFYIDGMWKGNIGEHYDMKRIDSIHEEKDDE